MSSLNEEILMQSARALSVPMLGISLSQGGDIKYKDELGNTALHLSVISTPAGANIGNQSGYIRALLNNDTSVVNIENNMGRTPLHLAAEIKNSEVLALLLRNGADVNSKSANGWTPLHLAAKNGYEELLTKLLGAGADVNAKSTDGWTPLHLAAKNGHNGSLTELLGAGADVNAKSADGSTALHLAAQNGHEGSLTKLLGAGADVNSKSADGSTALHLAAKNGHNGSLTELLGAGADVNAKSADGSTALHLAAKNGHKGSLTKLLGAGADVNVKDLSEETPLSIAQKHHSSVAALKLLKNGASVNGKSQLHDLLSLALELDDLQLLQFLYVKNADLEPNFLISERETPLYYASSRGSIFLVKKLLKKGADVSVKSTGGRTPLHAAAAGNYVKIVKKLLSKNADPSCADVDGFTPLHLAAKKGRYETAKVLLEAGVDVDSRAVDCLTPLHLAAQNGHPKLVRLLLKEGADIYAESSDFSSAIHLASSNHNYKIIDILLDQANLHDVRDKNDLTFLQTIAQTLPPSSGDGLTEITDVKHVAPSLLSSILEPIGSGSIPPNTLATLLKKHRIHLSNPASGRVTPLHLAVRANNKIVVDQLLSLGGKVGAQDDEGLTPLHLAVVNYNLEIFKLLFANSPGDIRVQDKQGWTPLHLAVAMLAPQEQRHTSRLAFFRALTEEVRPFLWDSCDKLGRTPLLLAMEARIPEIETDFFKKQLLEVGPSDSEVGSGSLSKLQYAARFKSSIFVKSILSRNNLNVNYQSEGGWTALALAVYFESHSVMSLLNAGADCNIAADGGWTPLHLASLVKTDAISDLLLHNDADRHAKLNDGNWLPLHVALKNGRWSTAMTLMSGLDNSIEEVVHGGWTCLHLAAEGGSVMLIDKIINKGKFTNKNVDVNAKSTDGSTALHLAAQNGHEGSLTKLLGVGADVNSKSADGWTPLHLAAKNGHEGLLTKLLGAGADVNSKGADGSTALHLAAQNGHEGSLTKLLGVGADVNSKSTDGWTPLHLAAQNGHEGSLTKLLGVGADVNSKGTDGSTALHLAAQNGHEGALTKLLGVGADVNSKSADGWTPLHLAAQNGHEGSLTKLLGADVNSKGADGWTPLHLAAKSGHLRISNQLILGNADITSLVNNLTPLYLAASGGHVKIALLLLRNGANIYDISDQPYTLLSLLSEESVLTEVRSLFTSNRIIEFPDKVTPLHLAAAAGNLLVISDLLKRGGGSADPKTKYGWTPLHLAAQSGKNLAVAELISLGANVDEKNLDGYTALHFAANFNRPDALIELLNHGATVDSTCNRGLTPLHLAVMKRNLEVARFLLKEGKADVNLRSEEEGLAPLHLSILVGDMDIFNLLIDYRADTNTKITSLGLTPLHLAVLKHDYVLIRKLLDNGADTKVSLDVKNPDRLPSYARELLSKFPDLNRIEGKTPLHLAAECGYTNVVIALLNKGADVDAIDADHSTPLHLAAKNEHIGVLRALLKGGAIHDAIDLQGKKALNFVKYGTDCHNLLTAVRDIFYSPIRKDSIAVSLSKLVSDDVVSVLSARESITRKTTLRSIYDRMDSRYFKSFLKTIGSIMPLDMQRVINQADLPFDFKCVKKGHLVKSVISSEGGCLLLSEDQELENDEELGSIETSVDAEKLLRFIEDLPELERDRLISLAEEVEVTGRFKTTFKHLVSSREVMTHLTRAGRISKIFMHGVMAKNILTDFLNGNHREVAINIGFMVAGQGLAKLAEVASLKGLKLASEGKLLLGLSLRVASPFLARGTSIFVVYDLVNQVKALKSGDQGALVGVVGNGIYLGLDSIGIGIEVAEIYGLLEGVSSITGPIGAVIGVVVLIGTDIYVAVETVKRESRFIHLTGWEKFTEGLRAFAHMPPRAVLQALIMEKEANNLLVKNAISFLKENESIQKYIFASDEAYEVVKEPSPECIRNEWASHGHSPIICSTKKIAVRSSLNNQALLDKKKENNKWSRVRPDDPSEGQLFCLPQGDDEPVSGTSYVCKNAIGLSYSANRTGNYTLVDLGNGNDKVVGFKGSPHIFHVGNGDKDLEGGDKDDIFVLRGDETSGKLNGSSGIDTLDLTQFAKNAAKVEVDLVEGQYVIYDRKIIRMCKIEKVLGRRERPELISTACNTKFLDGQGGSENATDTIEIRNQVNNIVCNYRMQIVVRPNTNIYNQAYNGEFDYIVLPSRGKAVVNISNLLDGMATSKHNFFFNSTVFELMGIYIQDISQTFNYKVRSAIFSFLSTDRKLESAYGGRFDEERFNITISNILVNASYTFSNGAQINVGGKSNIYLLDNTNKSSEEVIRDYLPVANRVSKMSFFIQSVSSNETVIIGSGNHEVIHSNPGYRSHLVGNGGENVYVIDSETTEVIIHDVDEENSIDTIDLRNVVKKGNCELKVIRSENDLLLRATVKEQAEYCTVRLKDGVERYNKTLVVLKNVPMRISFDNDEWSLKPQPLMFEKDKKIIVVTNQDVEEGTEIITPRKAGNYKFVRSNDNDLMITNAFDSTITKNDLCTITLSKFYEEPKMETLLIKFADKEITLKEHQEQISSARDVNFVKKEHEDKVYNDVFNHIKSSTEVMMLSDQSYRHRHEHSRRTRHHRSTTSSSTRPTGWINDLFGWVKSSVSGLLSFKPALPKDTSSTPSSISQVDARVDVNGTIMLLDMLIRKVTGQKYISTADQSISPLEAQGYALNITKGFEKIVEQAGLKSGVSMHRLNIDFVGMHKEIIGKIMSGKFSKISGILNSYVERACPGREAGYPGKLSPKKFDKFMVEFNSGLNVVLNQSIKQILHNGDGRLEVGGVKQMSLEPQSYLSNASVQGHSKVSTCLSDIGVTKLVNNLGR